MVNYGGCTTYHYMETIIYRSIQLLQLQQMRGLGDESGEESGGEEGAKAEAPKKDDDDDIKFEESESEESSSGEEEEEVRIILKSKLIIVVLVLPNLEDQNLNEKKSFRMKNI